jgi:uncharacterized membrane protein
VLLGAATLTYPVLVYFVLQHHGARALVLPLALLALARLVFRREWGWSAAIILLAMATQLFDRSLPVKLYPVVVSLGLLATFGFSLARPPSFAERIARIREPDLPPQAVAYTRRVTQAWCVYFIVNASIAGGIALWGSDRAWALYSGGIAYVAAGLLFAGEFLLRQRLRRKWRGA